MSADVKTIGHREINPHVVVKTLCERVDSMTAIYVVSIENGIPTLYTSGPLNELCLAAMTIQKYAQDQLFDE